MQFVPRSDWGAKFEKGSSHIPGPVLGVTLHWEGPHMGTWPHEECAAKVQTIERFHKVTRGWAGIAYSLVVCPHNAIFEGRGVGVRPAANGTSGIGGNDEWYAVCYLGGQGDGFTGQQGMRDAIAYLRAHGAGNRVNGHRDHHATECPGQEIYDWLNSTDFNTPPEDDMTQEQLDQIIAAINEIPQRTALELAKVNVGTEKEPLSIRNAFRRLTGSTTGAHEAPKE